MHRIIDSSRTHGTQPDFEDSTPNVGLCVRLLPLSIFIHYLSYIFLLLLFFSLTAFRGPFVPCLHATDALSVLIIPGGFFNRSLFIRALCPTHVSSFHTYLLLAIICIDMTKVLAKLGCLAPVLTPTFPIFRLGGKWSTSAIVTAGLSGRVPQMGEVES